MLTVDNRCTMHNCTHLTGIYRMVGTCSNCMTGPILVLFSEDHETVPVRCPTCGVRKVYVSRRATEEEIPLA